MQMPFTLLHEQPAARAFGAGPQHCANRAPRDPTSPRSALTSKRRAAPAAPATARGELRRGGPEAEKPSLRVKLKAQMQAKGNVTLLAMAIGAARTHWALQRFSFAA